MEGISTKLLSSVILTNSHCYGRIPRQYVQRLVLCIVAHSLHILFSYRYSYSVRFLCITFFVLRSFCKFHRLFSFISLQRSRQHYCSFFVQSCQPSYLFSVQLSSHTTFVSIFAQFLSVSCIFVVSQLSFVFLSNLYFFVSLLATVIVILYKCNKDELEPWTILELFALIFR